MMGMKLRVWLVIIAVFWAIFTAQLANAAAIVGINIEALDRQTIVTVSFDGDALDPDAAFMLSEGSPRYVLDWARSAPKLSHRSNRITGIGAIIAVRYSARKKGVRLVLDLQPNAAVLSRRAIGRDYVVTLSGGNVAESNVAAETQLPKQPVEIIATSRPIPTSPRFFKNAVPYPMLKPTAPSAGAKPDNINRRPVIVIDPGHGGYDPGALGQKGTKEKDITYAASIELQKQLLATGRYDIILTRSKDVYVDHEERLRIARAGHADLFISIHADSAGPNARGATVYTLADRAKTRSRRVVNTQNWIMDVDLTEQTDPVGDILVDLAQRSTKNNSTQFADILLGELAATTRLINNSHRRAGYFVLLAPDVPAVLLELGFLSHIEDEKLLIQASHRRKVMRSVTTAINRYFDTQKP